MRILFIHLLALVVLFAAAGQAHAYVQINIDLSSQTMIVHSGSGPTYVWSISSGKTGHPTPRGMFRPLALYAMAYSPKYDDAPMPHSIVFHGQYAIHGTLAVADLGRPASHGCIRLSPGNAATLFAMVQRQGAVIRIVGSPPSEIARGEWRSASALAFAPIRHTRTLNQWALDPLGR
jgi:lipoprotein-anchoring transpeptidase ErfK/SrfK